jgi:hypothetical protein
MVSIPISDKTAIPFSIVKCPLFTACFQPLDKPYKMSFLVMLGLLRLAKSAPELVNGFPLMGFSQVKNFITNGVAL